MRKSHTIRNRLLAAATCIMLMASAPMPAHAVSKEIVQLQTQVQQLVQMVQRLQSTLDSHFGVLQNQAQQTAAAAAQMSAAVTEIQQKLNAQNEALSGKVQTVSGQIQSLNDSVDELRSRLDRLQASIKSLQSQLQNIQAPPPPTAAPGAEAPEGTNSASPGSGPSPGSPGSPGSAGDSGAAPPGAQSSAGTAPAAAPAAAPQLPAAAQAPPLEQTFQSAMRDYEAGRYKLATSEFGDVVQYYPLDDLAGTAQFYLGEIAYHQKRYDDAVNNYNVVLEGFSGNSHAPTAELHKGLALLALNKRTAGIHELRLLLQRYPRTPEAADARRRLNELGVRNSLR
jgi:TolA-binding protein